MHVYFINYHRFQDASGVHIYFLANTLEALGVKCTVCLPEATDSVHSFGPVRFSCISYLQLRLKILFNRRRFREEGAVFHAWSPREKVRRMTEFAASRTQCPYFVHMEDNEELIYAAQVGLLKGNSPIQRFRRFFVANNFIHPKRYQTFLANSSGATCIIDTLKLFLPDNIPSMTFWPACEKDFFALPAQPDMEFRAQQGIPAEAIVISYTGNIHQANCGEISTLYDAVAELNRRGYCVRLIRTGGTHAQLPEETRLRSARYTIELGSLPPTELIRPIAAADILVQPGRPSRFNEYRFPSKLPMFLASGRPVVLPATNIGSHLEHGENCLLLNDGSTEELVYAIESLLQNPDLRSAIGIAGRKFAQERFDWQTSARAVLNFYKQYA